MGVDYSLEYSNITFPPAMVGPRTECLNVTITDDTFAEEDESFELELSSTDPSNALIQGTTQTEITITDDDSKGKLILSVHSLLVTFHLFCSCYTGDFNRCLCC